MIMENSFDAIVVGSGITGGWAAKELTEKGLKTLVLERGRDLKHIVDYPTANKAPWELENHGKITEEDRKNHPIQSLCYAFDGGTKHLWVNDNQHPYTHDEEKPFRWIRGYHVGGRSLLWARQCYRWSNLDFEANEKDGFGIDWPIRYEDIAPWYDYVERFVGVSGSLEGISTVPDGQFLPPMDMNCVEKHVKKGIEDNWSDRKLIIGRSANITQNHNGRNKCQHRDLCYRGCPFGAAFSSQSATLPAAQETGNLTLRPNSVVVSVVYDEKTDKASGVKVLDAISGEMHEFKARVIFLCASTLGSTWVMLNSANSVFPNGLGNSSGVLGKYLMDHHFNIGADARFDGFDDQYYFGGRPNGIYVPRFRNVNENRKDFVRGYGYQGSASREEWTRGIWNKGFGAAFKENISRPGHWFMNLDGFGEHLPYEDNFVELNPDVKDVHGLPSLKIHCTYRDNEDAMRKDMLSSAVEMLEAAGGKDVTTFNTDYVPGFSIHEMGTARMGNDPKESILNRWNQCHEVPNLFITDGACMTSSACQNPSITYMALTARAVDYAVKELNRQNI